VGRLLGNGTVNAPDDLLVAYKKYTHKLVVLEKKYNKRDSFLKPVTKPAGSCFEILRKACGSIRSNNCHINNGDKRKWTLSSLCRIRRLSK
jgi:hypothetical protein